MEAVLNKTELEDISEIHEDIRNAFIKYTSLEISEEEVQSIVQSRNYFNRGSQPSNERSLKTNIINIMNERTPFGFTTGSHTGEEVFLVAYHPAGHRPAGHITNMQVNKYMFDALGLKTPLLELSQKLFAKHTEVLAGLDYKIDVKDDEFAYLTVTKGENNMTIRAFSSVAYVNDKPVDLGSVTVYIDVNETFYLPADILKKTGL